MLTTWSKCSNITIEVAAKTWNGAAWLKEWIFDIVAWMDEKIWADATWLTGWFWDRCTWLHGWVVQAWTQLVGEEDLGWDSMDWKTVYSCV